MEQDEFDQLLERYQNGEATPEEADYIDAYYKAFELRPDSTNRPNEFWEEIKAEIDARIDQQHPFKIVRLWPRIAAAASILLFLSFGGYLLLHKSNKNQIAVIKPGTFKNDIQPGGNNAILTLAGGKQIILKTAKNGLLANQGHTHVQKANDGQIIYDAADNNAPPTAVTYNTITTKRGDKYNVTLPDGTVAYLDAASSLYFPTAFNGHDREVTITGQVYFEVAHDKTKPFRVTAKGETVEVLGTHFNINAYDDEPVIKTTLLEGSVKITIDGQQALLEPGQQAQIGSANKITVIRADIEETMAWKNGLFHFNDADMETTMRQLTRWYDVDVEYQGASKSYHFDGYISRESKLSSVLKILQLSGVRFSIDGKKLIVYQ